MEFRNDRSVDPQGAERGQPGSDDEYARGAAADGGAGAPAAGSEATATSTSATADGDLARQVEEQRDKYLRLAADYDNFRRRAARERQEAAQRGQADMIKGLLDTLDDLGRFAHVDPATVDPVTLVQGVEMVERKLLKALGGQGLEVVNPVDQPFDPALHEAVATEPAASPEDDHMVARVYQPGYVLNGQLLRPARVVVKQWNG
jgi:molecular chaperone GrpE